MPAPAELVIRYSSCITGFRRDRPSRLAPLPFGLAVGVPPQPLPIPAATEVARQLPARPAPAPQQLVRAAPPLRAMAASQPRFDGMTAEQVKASVYGYAGDLRDDKISPQEMAGIVSEAAERLDDAQKASLESLLRVK